MLAAKILEFLELLRMFFVIIFFVIVGYCFLFLSTFRSVFRSVAHWNPRFEQRKLEVTVDFCFYFHQVVSKFCSFYIGITFWYVLLPHLILYFYTLLNPESLTKYWCLKYTKTEQRKKLATTNSKASCEKTTEKPRKKHQSHILEDLCPTQLTTGKRNLYLAIYSISSCWYTHRNKNETSLNSVRVYCWNHFINVVN